MHASTWIQRMLFPKEIGGVLKQGLPSALLKQNWFDPCINYEQKVGLINPLLHSPGLSKLTESCLCHPDQELWESAILDQWAARDRKD